LKHQQEDVQILSTTGNMKKFFGGQRLIIGAIIATAMLAGCKSDDAAGTASTTGTSASGTTGKDNAAAVSLIGAGSTFVNPAMSTWADQYKDAKVNYQSLGSGAGIAQYKQGTVDFGATDAPLSDKELKEMPTETLHIPVVAGAEAIVYNVPGVPTGLKLSGDTLAGIFLGKIVKWNDPALAKDNPGVTLPDMAIAVAHRADGSGTTFIFSDYLSAVSPDWAKGPGKGKTLNWPVGTGGKGSDGVAGLVKQSPGSIGYVELAYATQNKMTFAQVKNAAGSFVSPSPESTSAAANEALTALQKDVRTSIVNEGGKDSYPICGFTYVLVSKMPKDAAKSKAVVDFLKWAIGPGQKLIVDKQYAPLPQSIVDLNTAALSSVQGAK